jgi:class 3 adenylate cyclase
MLDQGNRTFIGSVVFVDIVGYSKKSVSEQITMKDRFTGLLTDALKDIAPEQRIILDTGDGAALSFLGDPEDALFVGMHMRDLLRRAMAEIGMLGASEGDSPDTGVAGELHLRIGINLGPVKLIRDINGHPNIVGDGINVAQRIMSFAKPGQIVVSRSYFDVVSVISDEYAKLFKYEGSRTDKHVREHEIYVVGESAAAFNQARAGMEDRAASTNPRTRPVSAAASAETPGVPSTGDATSGMNLQALLQDRKKLALVGGALGVLVLILFIAVLTKKSADRPLEAPRTEVAKAELPPAAVAAPAAELPKTGEPSASTQPVDAARTAAASPAAGTNAAKPAIDDKKPAAKAEPVKADLHKPIVQGSVTFSIQPWGEVFINGKSIGNSPPLKQTKLAPGKYKIEIKNSTLTPYLTNIEVKAKEDVPIKYKFQ